MLQLLTEVQDPVGGAQVVVQILGRGSKCIGALVSELLLAPARVTMGVLRLGVRLTVPVGAFSLECLEFDES